MYGTGMRFLGLPLRFQRRAGKVALARTTAFLNTAENWRIENVWENSESRLSGILTRF